MDAQLEGVEVADEQALASALAKLALIFREGFDAAEVGLGFP